MESLTARQIKAIEVSARTTSVLSVLGSLFIISTFLLYRFFRRPINRLVFFAAWGNIMANVATLMSTSAIPQDSTHFTALCEFQGVLIQWFMMADSLWVFFMALNVMLVFFHGYDSHQLRCLEKWYLLFAYGLPFIPALTYIFLDHYGPQRIIGPATIWCWVAEDVAWMRIAFFYAPVWVYVSATLAIYVVTGFRIFRTRAVLRSFSKHSRHPQATSEFGAGEENNTAFISVGNKIIVTTQIKYDVHPHDGEPWPTSSNIGNNSTTSFSSTRNFASTIPVEEPSSGAQVEMHKSRIHWEIGASLEAQDGPHHHRGHTRGGYRATVSATNHSHESAPNLPGSSFATPRGANLRLRNVEGNAAAYAYLKVSFLMFVALIVVWVPSTVNRLDHFIYRERSDPSISYGLNLASALVLPLQGFWNAMIYISTTWPECKRAYGIIMSNFTRTASSYRSSRPSCRQGTMKSSQKMQDSNAELPLQETLNGERVCLSSVSVSDDMAEAKSHHNPNVS